jgi:hypothetical protein
MSEQPKLSSNPKDILIARYKGVAEEKRFFNQANKARSESSTLLNPSDIAGEYDVARGLLTMLGGKARVITQQDLIKFKQITQSAKTKFRKGITAKGIIDLSVPIPPQPGNGNPTDKQRANKEIKFSVPVSHIGSTIRFMTNAGPDSERQRHYVKVEFINYEAIAASAITVDKLAKEMIKSPLRISCDCGRWRYWLAYLATIGGYNAGHPETAFPKIRNPGLVGVGCKHILRTMQAIMKSPSMTQYMTKMVLAGRATIERKRHTVRVTEQRKLIDRIATESKRTKTITSTEERSQARKAALLRNAANKPNDALAKMAQSKAQKQMNGFVKDAMKNYGLTKDVAEKLFKNAMKAVGK